MIWVFCSMSDGFPKKIGCWWVGWVLSKFFLDFWIFFNFAKPLSAAVAKTVTEKLLKWCGHMKSREDSCCRWMSDSPITGKIWWENSCNTDMEQVVKGGVGKEMYKTKLVDYEKNLGRRCEVYEIISGNGYNLLLSRMLCFISPQGIFWKAGSR